MNTIFRYLSVSVLCQTVGKSLRPPRGNGSDRPDAREYQRGGSDQRAGAGSFLDSTGEGCEHFQPIPHGISGEHQKSGCSGVMFCACTPACRCRIWEGIAGIGSDQRRRGRVRRVGIQRGAVRSGDAGANTSTRDHQRRTSTQNNEKGGGRLSLPVPCHCGGVGSINQTCTAERLSESKPGALNRIPSIWRFPVGSLSPEEVARCTTRICRHRLPDFS